MQSSLVSYSNNRVIRWVWNNANLIYLISGFSILHLQTDNQLAKHCIVVGGLLPGRMHKITTVPLAECACVMAMSSAAIMVPGL